MSEYRHKDGDCIDCKGPCKGHSVTCPHPPGSRQCDHCTLWDDDETSEQALAAKALKTREYSR